MRDEDEEERTMAAEITRLRQENARLAQRLRAAEALLAGAPGPQPETEQLARQAEFAEQLLGIVSHDLRNPLTAIQIVASSLLRQGDLDARTVKGLARVRSGADRAMRLVRDLLDFSQVRLGGDILLQRRPTDLNVLAQQALEDVRSAFPERTLRLHPGGDAQGEWDADRLVQVVENLLTNALKFSPPEGAVTVRTWDAGERVGLSVHNTGEPIPEDLLPHVFELLRHGSGEVERGSGSVGLGLYIVRHLVQVHGGQVTVRSSAEEGTTFTVQLPRRAPEP